MNPSVDLDTHIEDFGQRHQIRGLRDVVLLSHSYGGMVATVSPTARDRVSQLIISTLSFSRMAIAAGPLTSRTAAHE